MTIHTIFCRYLASIIAIMFWFTLPQLANAAPRDIDPLKRIEWMSPKLLSDVVFFDKTGKERTLKEFKGKVVLLNFWATWCTACVAEMPDLDYLQESLVEDNVVVLTLSEDYKGVGVVEAFFQEHAITSLEIFMDKNQRVFHRFGVVGLPSSYIINKEGLVEARILGVIDWRHPKILSLLKGMAQPS